MGIQGLLPNVKSICRKSHIKAFANQKVAVDAYVWLHRGAYSCSAELCQNIKTDRYVLCFVWCVVVVVSRVCCAIVFSFHGDEWVNVMHGLVDGTVKANKPRIHAPTHTPIWIHSP